MFDQLFSDMEPEESVGVLLGAQLGESPYEVQMVIRTNSFTPPATVQPKNHYVVKVHNMVEHQVVLGMFDEIALLEDHPLLYHHNPARVRVFVASPVETPEPLLQDIVDAHAHFYGTWRTLDDDFKDLDQLKRVFKAGYGVLGEMPKPFADKVAEVLTRHSVKHSIVLIKPGLELPMKLLLIDNTYFVALSYDVEVL